MLREWAFPREIGATFRGLAKTTIAVTNGVEMVFHRPFSSSADAVEVVVCAATNLVSTNWFPVATAVFAAGETDVPVALSLARLSGFGISGSCFLRFLESGDSDGDGDVGATGAVEEFGGEARADLAHGARYGCAQGEDRGEAAA